LDSGCAAPPQRQNRFADFFEVGTVEKSSVLCNTTRISLPLNYNMSRITKSKQNLQAQAALARSSRNSSTSRNTNQPSSQSSGPSSHPTPAVSPAPPDTPDVLSDEESDVQRTSENLYLYLPDIHVFEDLIPESPEEENGYHTDDDLSELEDDELEKSLKKQRASESELVIEIGQETRNVFHTLMRDVSQKEWKKAESNRSMGYGSKSSERTERWRRQKERGKKTKEAESRKSSVNQ